ncbi:transcriptional regulator, PucR family [Nocardia nova SH22a]|uniref:Transcriptional regulator, PucR family n=1 Tax=Nocardia nova SH22a TaxID=1415166 RepID=W5TL89_9NOCA|nr:helix-turn-helix domain-containing protein [Nocardia nova]AHH19894.1 transcriptional regulator, PucR family [Nocardia nova SH22a]
MAFQQKSTPADSVSAACLGDIQDLTERLMEAVFTDSPEWTGYSAVTRTDLEDGCRRFLTRALDLLGDRSMNPEHDDVAASIGKQRAEQGVPLEAMLRTFRLGGRIVWEALLDGADAMSPEDFRETGTAMWAVVDGMSSALVTSYRSTELARVRRDERRRHALIDDVLSGRAHDAVFTAHAARELNIPVTCDYRVLVARGDPQPLRLGAETMLSARGIRSVWHDRGDSTVGIIALEQHNADQVTEALSPFVRGSAGLSPTVAGLAAVNVAYTLATLALDTAPRAGEGILVHLDDRYPEALLLRSPDLAQLLVDRSLGPILALPAKERDTLVHTLTVWLAENCSAAHAAPRLHCHRNTVINRLQRITALLGHSLDSPRDHLELALGLIALEWVEPPTR